MVRSFGSDDWTMAIAALCSVGGWTLYIYKACHGLGHHLDYISDMDRINIAQAAFWQVFICSAIGMAFLKVSIALNLLRISLTRWYTASLWISIGLVSAYCFMGGMAFLLHCKPIQAQWDHRIENAKCYPLHVFIIFALVNTSFNILTDLIFATLPIPIVWNLHMKRRVRIYLIGVFSLGYITVSLGIVKSVYQLSYAENSDEYFNDSVVFWALVQFNTGILTASIPSLKPLVTRVLHLSEYTNSRSYSRRIYGRTLSRRVSTNRNSQRVWSIPRTEQFSLEELRSQEWRSDEVRLNCVGPFGGAALAAQETVFRDVGRRVDGERGVGAELSERSATGGILKTTVFGC
ncbi:hypothetical protein BDV28DRAFT_148912 [Aspergillus coremiiformis]|uniref:Rhodopsin domain-containing protein n=1 Tax=Aspergillus coremiiformis TaxID=138285 RepID=A0A5N6Z4G8_9EURO|nr:hypothetical protein BDV28DRAFT_148912 [Aspergillus coremiiformis]